VALTRYAYGALIGVIGGGLLVLASITSGTAGIVGCTVAALLAWFGVTTVLVALIYFADAPQLLGKRRANGTFPRWARAIWLPYFAIAALVLACIRLRTREAAADQVAAGIYVGRIPPKGLVPPGVTLVIDLCAEFAAARRPADATAYLAIPTLDGCAPHPADATAAVLLARKHPNVLVHCAAGHGRSATIAVLIALDRGLFIDGDDAIRAFQHVRRSVAPTSAQRALIARRAAT
jgi:protein-tyrosine phosphatase